MVLATAAAIRDALARKADILNVSSANSENCLVKVAPLI